MSVIVIVVSFAAAIVAVIVAFSLYTRSLARQVARAKRERSLAWASAYPHAEEPVRERGVASRRLAPVLPFSAAQRARAQRAGAGLSPEHNPART
jgi:hypothetical protein